jgi:hypothetical protein
MHPEPTHVPVSATVCGLPAALSVAARVPFSVPSVLGENVTRTGQLVPGAILEPQVLVSPKLALAAILVIFSVAVPSTQLTRTVRRPTSSCHHLSESERLGGSAIAGYEELRLKRRRYDAGHPCICDQSPPVLVRVNDDAEKDAEHGRICLKTLPSG